MTPALAEVRTACFVRGDEAACDVLRPALTAEVAPALAAGAPAPRLPELLAITVDAEARSWLACHRGGAPCADDADLPEHCLFDGLADPRCAPVEVPPPPPPPPPHGWAVDSAVPVADGWAGVVSSHVAGEEIGPRIVLRTGQDPRWAEGPWCALRPTPDGGFVGVAGPRCDAVVRLDGALAEQARLPVPPLVAVDPVRSTNGPTAWLGADGVAVADAAGVRFAAFADRVWRPLPVRADEVAGVAGAGVVAGGALHAAGGVTPLAGRCAALRDRVYCQDAGRLWDASASPRVDLAAEGWPPGWLHASQLPDQPPEAWWPVPVPPVTSREIVVRAAPGTPVALAVVSPTPGLPDLVRAEHEVAGPDGLARFRVPVDVDVQVAWRPVSRAQGALVVDLPDLDPHRVRVFGPDGRPAAGARVASREDVGETDADGWTTVSCRDLVSVTRGADAAVARCDAEEIHLVAGVRARCRWTPTGAEGWCDTLAEREGAGLLVAREQDGVWLVTPAPTARPLVLRPPVPVPADVAVALGVASRPGLPIAPPSATDPRVCVDPDLAPEGPVTLTFRPCPGVRALRVVDPDGTPVWTGVQAFDLRFRGSVDGVVWLPPVAEYTDAQGTPLRAEGDTLVTPRTAGTRAPGGDPRRRLAGTWTVDGGAEPPSMVVDGDTVTWTGAWPEVWTVTRVWAGGAELETDGHRALALIADRRTLVWWDGAPLILRR